MKIIKGNKGTRYRLNAKCYNQRYALSDDQKRKHSLKKIPGTLIT